MTDPISDMLTRIRNAGGAQLPTVEVPHSRLKESIANVLKDEGYVAAVEVAAKGKAAKVIRLQLKYQGRKPVIEGLRRISTPGRRVYTAAADIPRVRGGLGIVILTTPEGVMTGANARKKNLGGEVLAHVW
ncbi:MAG: 30S ribosomal protein S8 [Limisphaerales bacterium]